jgi:hypothetical protein
MLPTRKVCVHVCPRTLQDQLTAQIRTVWDAALPESSTTQAVARRQGVKKNGSKQNLLSLRISSLL